MRLDPRHPPALRFRAAALAELGELSRARADFLDAMRAAPRDHEILLDAADLCISGLGEEREHLREGLRLCRRGLRLAKQLRDKELTAEFFLLEGMALNQLGEPRQALQSLELAQRRLGDDPDLLLERGIAHFELCRFVEARRSFSEVLQCAPKEPWAHHYLGLLAERAGESRLARRSFARARRADPETFPRPVELSRKAFSRALQAALQRLPPIVRDALEEVRLSVDDLPLEPDLRSADPPLSPSILGIYRDCGRGRRSLGLPGPYSAIVLYQKNLERFARSPQELLEQIGITLIHEIGHCLGLSEKQLWARGLE